MSPEMSNFEFEATRKITSLEARVLELEEIVIDIIKAAKMRDLSELDIYDAEKFNVEKRNEST